MSGDLLSDVKNFFYIGSYQNTIKEAQNLKVTNEFEAMDRDIYLYRSYLALKQFSVIKQEISDKTSSPKLLAIKLSATYIEKKKQGKSIFQEFLQEIEEKAKNLTSTNLALSIATIYISEGKPESALEVLNSVGDEDLEILSLRIVTYLNIHRIDLARKELKVMTDLDEDNVLSQLSTAWVNMSLGGEKIQEAYYIYQELIDKYGSTSLLLNGQASTFLAQGKFEEANGALQEALLKESDCSDTLVNLIVLSRLSGKVNELQKRYLTQLRDSDSSHPFLEAYNKKEEDFRQMVQQYALSTS